MLTFSIFFYTNHSHITHTQAATAPSGLSLHFKQLTRASRCWWALAARCARYGPLDFQLDKFQSPYEFGVCVCVFACVFNVCAVSECVKKHVRVCGRGMLQLCESSETHEIV